MQRKAPEHLLTIDPGLQSGWALFEFGELIYCGYGPSEKILENLLVGVRKALVIVEVPVIYPGGKQEKPPQKILRGAVLAGRYIGRYEAWGHEVREVAPKAWKGTIPKPQSAKEEYLITRRVLRLSTPEERDLIQQTKSARAVQLNHNMIDAIGIGYKELGRKP